MAKSHRHYLLRFADCIRILGWQQAGKSSLTCGKRLLFALQFMNLLSSLAGFLGGSASSEPPFSWLSAEEEPAS